MQLEVHSSNQLWSCLAKKKEIELLTSRYNYQLWKYGKVEEHIKWQHGEAIMQIKNG